MWLLAAACLYLGWQLLNLYRLDRWLRLRSQIDPPTIGGIWGDVIGQVVRLHRRKQFHKQRLVQLFRELRRSTAALPDGVIILSTQNEIVWFNRQAARLLGLRGPVDIGLRIDNLIRSPEFVHYLHGDDFTLPLIIRPPVQSELVSCPAAGALRRRAVAAAGARRHASDAPGGDAQGFRRQCLARAAHAAHRHLRLSRHPGRRLRASTQAWAGPIRDMRAQAQRMNAIITDLLELSRLESTDGEAPREPIDVPSMLERLHRDALAASGRPRHVLLELECADGLYGAPHEIESAFTNLLVNGLKYTPAEGTVRMRWWCDEEGALFRGDRHRHRHSRRAHPAADRALLPRRSRAVARPGRFGARTGHRQARPAAPWRLARCASTEGKGSAFTCHFRRSGSADLGAEQRGSRIHVTNYGRTC